MKCSMCQSKSSLIYYNNNLICPECWRQIVHVTERDGLEQSVSEDITLETSMFKFSKIKAEDFNRGAAEFTLACIDKLANKDKEIIVAYVAEICKAYLRDTDPARES